MVSDDTAKCTLATSAEAGRLHEAFQKSAKAHQQSIAKRLLDDTGNPANVLCRIQEQHQVHARLVLLVVLCQVPLYACQ